MQFVSFNQSEIRFDVYIEEFWSPTEIVLKTHRDIKVTKKQTIELHWLVYWMNINNLFYLDFVFEWERLLKIIIYNSENRQTSIDWEWFCWKSFCSNIRKILFRSRVWVLYSILTSTSEPMKAYNYYFWFFYFTILYWRIFLLQTIIYNDSYFSRVSHYQSSTVSGAS